MTAATATEILTAPLLRYPEAGRFLGISERALFDLVRRGLIPVVRPIPGGRAVRFRRSDLENYIDNSAVKS